ncbi:hypothetical protein MJO52_00790 [Microbulbifer variabilis]|uniref:CHAT domain-containing protein n=1 Tax=Microbulbifer variabilis TaxID=266805 RepID=A0ABY4VE89_9GAMM|nr:hypothetical protein [Microbulbifer variabilis]USD21711.1 hypothetical protein MJO52_00790 [Microbulbifer variabilis]
MAKTQSKYGIFIIESLENGDYYDGKNLKEILKLSQIKCEYRYVHTREELSEAVKEFRQSNLRYLHLSCHANMDGIEVDNKIISNKELIEIFKGNIKKRRLFLSACKAGNRNMATVFINKCHGQSVIGTPINLRFDKAALFWPAFYHVINILDQEKMNKRSLTETIKRCVDLFDVPINYYHNINGQEKYLRRYKFRCNSITTERRILITKNI